MATLHCIAFFLACVFLLQEIQAQSSKSFEYKEEYDSSSSSHQENESFKKDISELEEQAGAVMTEICKPKRLLGMTCESGYVGRRFHSSIFSAVKKIIHTPTRLLYGVVYLSGKIVKCITKTIGGIPIAIINSLPSCLRDAFNEITSFLKSVLDKISNVLKSIFSFVKQVASCTIGLMRCAKDIFLGIYDTVENILKTVIINSVGIVRKIFALIKGPICPKPEPGKDPNLVVVQCGQCVFCSFQPNSTLCN